MYRRTFPPSCLRSVVINGYHQVCVVSGCCAVHSDMHFGKLRPFHEAFEQLRTRIILCWMYIACIVCCIALFYSQLHVIWRTSGYVLRTFIFSDLTSPSCTQSECFHLLYCLVKTLALRPCCTLSELFRRGADDNSPHSTVHINQHKARMCVYMSVALCARMHETREFSH